MRRLIHDGRAMVCALALAGACVAVLGRDQIGQAATPPPLRAVRGAVASDHPQASAAGLAILKAGGNAIDAACATALALGVVHPYASGMGGGGFALVYLAKEKRVFALDFRERAPAAIRPELYLKNGKPDTALSTQGGLAVATPGEVRGLGEITRRWGKLPFRKCVEPAERLARDGALVSWRLAESLAREVGGRKEPSMGAPGSSGGGAVPPGAAAAAAGSTSSLPTDPVFTAIFGKKALAMGERWRRPDLAWTLSRLRGGGPDAFYRGPIADEMVKAVKQAGGVLTAEDLRTYAATDRTPIEVSYRGARVVSMPPPSSGGTVLSETLGILAARIPEAAGMSKLGRGSSAYLHLLVEAFKHGFADRARHLGDSDFVKVDLPRLTSSAYHGELAKRIKEGAVLPRDAYGTPGAPTAPPRDGGTAHLAVIDAEGNAVSLTTTINLGFGARLVAGKTGVLLNNEMDDFSLQPGVPNAFGLIGSTQNAVAPGKRPLSSMTPTIVLEGDQVKLAVGGAGGPTIITATTQVLLNVLDWKLDAQAALAAPRIHHQWFPDPLMIEPEIATAKDVIENLEKRGHKVREIPRVGVVNLVVRTDKGLEAGAEPRSPSTPAGY
jgi:gamma-glutamyltranspeptidase/glutathione hydrolase